jgi:hypothetical protein
MTRKDRVIAIASIHVVGEPPPATVRFKRLALVSYTYDTATQEIEEDLIYLDDQVDNTETQRDVYRKLLQLRWLPPKLRNCVLTELGKSPREEKRRAAKERMACLYFEIDRLAEQMQKNGKGNPRMAATEQVAARLKMDASVLRRQLSRYKELRSKK